MTEKLRETITHIMMPTSKPLCADCGKLPRDGRKSRCGWCHSRHLGPDHQVSNRGVQWPAGADSRRCSDCSRDVPAHYMKTKTRCKPCELLRVRDRDAQRKYQLAPGERQRWFEAQDGRCFGCMNRQKVTGLAVHHSHLTGEALFMSCMTCNNGVLGTAQDNPLTLLRLALGCYLPPHTPGNAERIDAVIKAVLKASENEIH